MHMLLAFRDHVEATNNDIKYFKKDQFDGAGAGTRDATGFHQLCIISPRIRRCRACGRGERLVFNGSRRYASADGPSLPRIAGVRNKNGLCIWLLSRGIAVPMLSTSTAAISYASERGGTRGRGSGGRLACATSRLGRWRDGATRAPLWQERRSSISRDPT